MKSCGSSIFGAGAQFIKVVGGEFVAVQGSSIVEKLNVGDLRMPYKQIFKTRITLLPGQVDYVLDSLGLGENATFLAIKVIYNQKSVIEEDNFLLWSFDSKGVQNPMAQMMVLTGNSTNRINKIYITNPNTKYGVSLEVMLGVIDGSSSLYMESSNSNVGTLFQNLDMDSFQNNVAGESIVLTETSAPHRPLLYIRNRNIASVSRNNDLLTMDLDNYGKVFLHFVDDNEATDAHSLLNHIMLYPDTNLDDLNPIRDIEAPVVYFFENFGNTASNPFITLNGATGSFDTNAGATFSVELPIDILPTEGEADIKWLFENTVSLVLDNYDGTMSNVYDMSTLYDFANDINITHITQSGTYSLSLEVSDIAENLLNDKYIIYTIS